MVQTELGYLALVLHAHLPYVRHVEEDCLEERWLFEAITETYVPLLKTFEGLVRDGVDFRITMSLSPTLLMMLDDQLLLLKYENHLNKLIELAKKEVARTRKDPEANSLSVMYLRTFMGIRDYLEKHSYDLISRFKNLANQGVLELITTSATHGFMPAMETEESIYSQWETGLLTFEKYVGFRPKGVWLPECGFTPGLDRILQQFGIQYFFGDSHAIEHATPKPRRGLYAPLMTGYGLQVFARDRESSSQVWSSSEGYPGDYDYREYYRDIGYDLPLSYIQPFIHPKGIRVNTGIKYYRITGKGDEKEYYRPQQAKAKAAEHAGNFMFNRENQVKYLHQQMDRKPIIVAPYDAELFGHWWYEGPSFIDYLCRKIDYDQNTLKMITPSEYLNLYPTADTGHLPQSTWGRNGYSEVWINMENAWVYRHLHQAEKNMIYLAETFATPSQEEERALNMAGKQLLIAQSSDWTFIMDNKSMVDYAIRRVKEHIGVFCQLYHELIEHRIHLPRLEEWERRWPVFPCFSYQFFLPRHEHRVAIASSLESLGEPKRRKILMLSWEYPPKIIGGLSRAVYDLSRALVKQGEEVHVFTSYVEGSPAFEYMDGVYVHRISCLVENDTLQFMDWVLQLNLAMVQYFASCQVKGLYFQLIHAHDWLVSLAARELQKKYGLHMLATIHATEHGRNQGIFTDLQRKIHGEEWKLTHEAEKVIVCSEYMRKEVLHLFQLAEEKVIVIPNGVDRTKIEVSPDHSFKKDRYALPDEKIIFFVGRLVREKGAQYLVEAATEVVNACPEAKFIIAGSGPMKMELEQEAYDKGLDHKILFTGFIQDKERNELLKHAYIAAFPSIYEPFGIVALEAMAAGTPVLVSDTGGLAEIIQHGVSGLKVYPGMVSSVRDQLIYALKNEEHLAKMAKSATQTLNRTYHWDHLAASTKQVYDIVSTHMITV